MFERNYVANNRQHEKGVYSKSRAGDSSKMASHRTGNESVLIQLAQFWFPRLAIPMLKY